MLLYEIIYKHRPTKYNRLKGANNIVNIREYIYRIPKYSIYKRFERDAKHRQKHLLKTIEQQRNKKCAHRQSVQDTKS